MDALADRALQSTEHDADNDLNAPIQSRAQAIKDCATQIRNTISHCSLVNTLVSHIEKQTPEGRGAAQRTSGRRSRTPKTGTGHNDGSGGEDDPGSKQGSASNNKGGGPSFDSLSQ